MKKNKGCGNESCEAHKKKTTYKGSEVFCSKCGSPLVYICKDCYTQLPDDTDKYCVRCLGKHEDRKNNAKKIAGQVGKGALVVGGFILTYGKKVLYFAKDLKG